VKLRLYFDEDSMRHSLAEALRLRHLDVATPLEAGTLAYSDDQQLEWAASQQRVLFSYNCSDFCRLHGEFLGAGRHHAGIIVTQQTRFSVGEQLRCILRLVAARSAEDMRDQLEFLNNWA